MAIIITIAISYTVVSILVGLLDLLALYCQDQHFSDIPIGDIGYYETRNDILGFHNILFLPSLIVILPFLNIKLFLKVLKKEE